MTKPRLELDAELALRTIRAECGVDANGFGGDRARLAFRSGQLCVVLILARHGRISLDALELAADARMTEACRRMDATLRAQWNAARVAEKRAAEANARREARRLARETAATITEW